ncbi:MAG: glycoside hydrolase family 20 zincin-like fold domain-containing protein [Armatimonadota bacterium]|nr:glycoside hydrolase family 20 zincin-like fold domain-containing protein [Armatimonadota bacterium]
MRLTPSFILAICILAIAAGSAPAGTIYYAADALPTASGWQIYSSSSVENGSGITSSIVTDGGPVSWKLSDASSSYRCMLRNTGLGPVVLDTGATLGARVRLESASSSCYNIGIACGGSGGAFVAIKPGQVSLMDRNGSTKASWNGVTDANYHTYQISAKNDVYGNNSTGRWRVYRDGTLLINWMGSTDPNGFGGLMAGHAGLDTSGAGTGVWYFDWISGRNDGAFSPTEWDPAPPSPPAAPSVTFPYDGSTVNSLNPAIRWSGETHDRYQVHVNTTNNPSDANGWDSGEVTSSASSCICGPLAGGTYYVFVRLRGTGGWGDWSSAGRSFVAGIRVRVIPEAQEMTWKTEPGFLVDDQTKIVINASPDDKDSFTANQLRRKVWDMTGHLLPIVEGAAGAPTSNVIAVGDPARNTAVSALVSSWPEATGKASKSEGYILGVRSDSVVIGGFDQRGTFYGCQMLIQLLEHYRTSRIDSLFCYDYPDLQLRGMYVSIVGNFDLEWAQELITEHMARYKMSCVMIDLTGVFPYDSHPELPRPANPPTKLQLLELVGFAKKCFLEVIPHGYWWTETENWQTNGTLHSDLREYQTLADPNPAGTTERLCPRHAGAQQLMHDILDEHVAAFDPTYEHIGWSEMDLAPAPTCPHCAGTDVVPSFAEYIWNDRNHLMNRTKPVRPVVWGDMLREDMPAGREEGTWQSVPLLPRDLLIVDWDYSTKTDFPSLQIWNDYGFQSVGCPYGYGYLGYVGKENIYYWGKSAKKYGVLGMLAFNKFRIDYKTVLQNDIKMKELACYPYVAEWAWTPERPYWNPYPYDSLQLVTQAISPDRPSGFTATPAGQNVSLQWTNPSQSSLQGVWACYRTDRYPTEPIDGVFVCDINGSPSSSMNFTHTAAPLGATIYYAVFSHDGVRHFSPAVTASVANGSPLALSDLSLLPDGRTVNVAGGVVTSVYQDCFYVQSERRINGLRVESTEPVSVGQILTIAGTLGKTGHERSVAALLVTATGQKLLTDPSLAPLGVKTSALGGADRGFSPGSGGIGLHNIGLLMRVFGRVENRDPGGDFFRLNDGAISGGAKVKLTETRTPIAIPAEDYVAVTGVSSLDTDGKSLIWPRAQPDILPLL